MGIESFMLLVSGLILAAAWLHNVPGIGKILKDIGNTLANIGAVVGIIDIILFIVALF